MKPGSRRNIEPVLADVRHPKPKTSKKNVQPSAKQWSPRRWLYWGGIVALLVVALWAVNVGGSIAALRREFGNLLGGFTSFDSGLDYEGSLDKIDGGLANLDSQARLLALAPKLQNVPGIIGDLRGVVGVVKEIGQSFANLTDTALATALAGDGRGLLENLTNIGGRLVDLENLVNSIKSKAQDLGVDMAEIDTLSGDLGEVRGDLGTFIAFLDQPEPKHLVLLFENPSEMRPAGGFAGSYGDLVIERGGMRSLTVNDIYYPDHFLSLEVVPPIQLQSLTPDWGARDTGWFFDFSRSGAKLLEYLGASDIYAKDNIQFEGVIALNVRVVEDLLRLTGPIEVPEYDMKLTADNFMRTIQEEVETSHAPGQNPKVVLQFAAPRILDALGKLEGPKREQLLRVFAARAHNKDIQFYFTDSAMETLVTRLGVAGKPYGLTGDFTGDYLALVNTNVAGGKTDFVVEQRAVLHSQIATDGQVTNNLLVTRSHRGQNESEPWYRAVNQNFFKIFTAPGSSLTSIRGGAAKDIRQWLDYHTVSYATDRDLAEVEDTRTILGVEPDGYAEGYSESGKNVFATWFNVDPGQSRTLEAYWRAGTVTVADGAHYTFVLDKQAGSEMNFEYSLAAPAGYYFAEVNSDLYQYRNDKLPAQVKIELTLKQK